MAVTNEKAAMTGAETDSPKPLNLNHPNKDSGGDGHSSNLDFPVRAMTDDNYSHGLKLVILAGASLIAVFLIALDQVGSTLVTYFDTERTSDTKGLDYRRHRNS
jgi:hypothetical protein